MQQLKPAHVITQILGALVLAGFLAAPGVQATRGERAAGHQKLHLRANRGRDSNGQYTQCPGSPPCNNNGDCDENTGTCWCSAGYGSTDCSTTEIETFRIRHVNDDAYKDLLGDYKRVGMYLEENPTSPSEVKFISYDFFSEGWTVAKLNSTCTDDICMFAYGKDLARPPPKGYVFGGEDKHVYYKQLIFDDADVYGNGLKPGIHLGLSYTPDPNSPDVGAGLTMFNGRYVQQPRYVHARTGKYAIMPLDLNSPGKTWAIVGLMGEPRRWKILSTARDPSFNRYMVPKGPWEPANFGIDLEPGCSNNVLDATCEALAQANCALGQTSDSIWVRKCCKSTCGTCDEQGQCQMEAFLQFTKRAMKANLSRA